MTTLYGAARIVRGAGPLAEGGLCGRAGGHGPEIRRLAIYEHCLPFNVSRAYDEASGIDQPDLDGRARPRDVGGAAGLTASERKSLYRFGYRRSAGPGRAAPLRVMPVIVVGAGPVGLCRAIDLAQRGVPVVLLDDADRIGEGSRGICYAKRTLEILDRLGVGEHLPRQGRHLEARQGLSAATSLLYAFDLLPEEGHKMPAFINLQQYYLEKFLVERAAELPTIDLRWRNKVRRARRARNDGVSARLSKRRTAPIGLDADWVIAADGARSTVRELLGLDFQGQAFEDRFLIADVKMRGRLPDRAPVLVRPALP